MRLALLGKPGAGKGTQSPRLARHLGVPLVATGELLRRQADSGAARELADLLARGELVPDAVVVALVADALASASAKDGYVLDGFPRTLAQALHSDAPDLDVVVGLDVPDAVALSRIAARAEAGRTDDARGATTASRLRTFHTETEPVLEHYRRRGMLVSVDGTQPPDRVTEAILRQLPAVGDGRAAEPHGLGM